MFRSESDDLKLCGYWRVDSYAASITTTLERGILEIVKVA